MDWKEKFEKGLDQSLTASKKFFNEAKHRAIEIGDQSVLSLEIKQLESRHTDLLTKLGSQVYDLLVEEERSTVTSRSAGVKEILEDIKETRDLLDDKKSRIHTK
ncbi:MAG: hypothetical protein ACLFQW_05280 [Spirochaetaceae bacterium]